MTVTVFISLGLIQNISDDVIILVWCYGAIKGAANMYTRIYIYADLRVQI